MTKYDRTNEMILSQLTCQKRNKLSTLNDFIAMHNSGGAEWKSRKKHISIRNIAENLVYLFAFSKATEFISK